MNNRSNERIITILKMIKKMYKTLVSKLPYVRELKSQLEEWNAMMAFPPGHFYSPIVDYKSLNVDELANHNDKEGEYLGVELNGTAQKKLLDEFSSYYKEIPFPKTK